MIQWHQKSPTKRRAFCLNPSYFGLGESDGIVILSRKVKLKLAVRVSSHFCFHTVISPFFFLDVLLSRKRMNLENRLEYWIDRIETKRGIWRFHILSSKSRPLFNFFLIANWACPSLCFAISCITIVLFI